MTDYLVVKDGKITIDKTKMELADEGLDLGGQGRIGSLYLRNRKNTITTHLNGQSGFISAEGLRIGALFIGSIGQVKQTQVKGHINFHDGLTIGHTSIVSDKVTSTEFSAMRLVAAPRVSAGELVAAPRVSVGGNGSWGKISSISADNKEVISISGGGISLGGNGYGGVINFLSPNNNEPVTEIDSAGKISVKGHITLKDIAGNTSIHLDGSTGDITLSGADCAEEFDIVDKGKIDPGTVLVIHEDGKLSSSKKPYDKRVAGVVSGGEGYHPGIILDRNPKHSKRLPIALTGKTYCKVDAQHVPIEPGDLLTTSSTPGHAMKADDPSRAFGAVIGKALSQLKEGRGIIPLLVSLQ